MYRWLLSYIVSILMLILLLDALLCFQLLLFVFSCERPPTFLHARDCQFATQSLSPLGTQV